jgi:cytoskeletal protein RodZ
MTWIIIFVIIIFTGLLTAALFFTWLRQGKGTKEALLEAKKAAFPESEEEQGPKEENFKEPPKPE